MKVSVSWNCIVIDIVEALFLFWKYQVGGCDKLKMQSLGF